MSARNATPGVPAYRLHKARGCAVVTLGGRNYYLGTFGSPESRAKYNRLIAEYLRGSLDRLDQPGAAYPVGRLCGDFIAWAKREFRGPAGEEGRSVDNCRQALRPLFE